MNSQMDAQQGAFSDMKTMQASLSKEQDKVEADEKHFMEQMKTGDFPPPPPGAEMSLLQEQEKPAAGQQTLQQVKDQLTAEFAKIKQATADGKTQTAKYIEKMHAGEEKFEAHRKKMLAKFGLKHQSLLQMVDTPQL